MVLVYFCLIKDNFVQYKELSEDGEMAIGCQNLQLDVTFWKDISRELNSHSSLQSTSHLILVSPYLCTCSCLLYNENLTHVNIVS